MCEPTHAQRHTQDSFRHTSQTFVWRLVCTQKTEAFHVQIRCDAMDSGWREGAPAGSHRLENGTITSRCSRKQKKRSSEGEDFMTAPYREAYAEYDFYVSWLYAHIRDKRLDGDGWFLFTPRVGISRS